jgi:DNA-binding response OmpR family regulator
MSQTARRSALPSIGAIRWPYRVIAVDSPAGPLTQAGHQELLNHGIDLHPYPDGPSTLLGLATEDPAAVLAPTDLAGVDFVRFVQAITAWSDVPVLIGLAEDPTSHEKAFQALDAGARGLIALPAGPYELATTLKQFGLTHNAAGGTITYGALELDRPAHLARVAGTAVHLSPLEFRLVNHLITEAPRVVPVSEVAAVLGEPGQPADSVRVRACIRRARQRLNAASPGQPPVVETVRGLGYRIAES